MVARVEGNSAGMCDNPLVLHSCNPVDLKSVLSHEDLIIGLASDHLAVLPVKDCGVDSANCIGLDCL